MKYDDDNRGKIQYHKRAKQILDYSNLKYRNITPSDIDGFFEYANKTFVFYEYKLNDAPIAKGQELAFTRVVDGLTDGGRNAIFFVCRHNEINPEKDINAANAIVDKFYWNNKWYNGNGDTVKKFTDRFMKWSETLNKPLS